MTGDDRSDLPRRYKLTKRQRVFVNEYLTDLNATQAAIRAGYSEAGAAAQASKLLRVPKVASEIATEKEYRMASLEITQSRVLSELSLLAFSDVGNYTIDGNGNVALREGAPKSARRAIASIKRKRFTDAEGNTTVETEIKLWDKPGPLKLAGRHVGLFPDRFEREAGGEDGKPVVIVVDTSLPPSVDDPEAAPTNGVNGTHN